MGANNGKQYGSEGIFSPSGAQQNPREFLKSLKRCATCYEIVLETDAHIHAFYFGSRCAW